MSQVESDSDAPPGFDAVMFAGIGMVARMLEPQEMTEPADWAALIENLEPWGEVPEPNSIVSISVTPTDRGPTVALSAGSEWSAEFLPWGSDGRLRARAKAAPEGSRVPSGGYSWEGTDLIVVRAEEALQGDSAIEVARAIEADDMEAARDELRKAGEVLGHYHARAKLARTTPPDPSRWNARTEWLEETLRATFIWRVKYSKNQPCTLSLGDVRLSDVSGDSLRIGRPRLADALRTHTCEFPAMRDLASLVHDLSRIHHSSTTTLELPPPAPSPHRGLEVNSTVRLGLRRGVLLASRGGWPSGSTSSACLTCSRRPHTSQVLPSLPWRFCVTCRPTRSGCSATAPWGALSAMAGFFGISSLFNTFPPEMSEIPIPLAFIAISYWLFGVYKRMSPPRRGPFTELG
ncbi:MAG: hypothetical protein Ct9H300mP30_4310 [Methanobacteriota archaeon]|nr:MAG: hypothetical protein Ct9H300mP30_4310 [Euryarchaeota archaeon]